MCMPHAVMEMIEVMSCCSDSLQSEATCFQCGHSDVLAEPCSCSLLLLTVSMATASDSMGGQITFMNARTLDVFSHFSIKSRSKYVISRSLNHYRALLHMIFTHLACLKRAFNYAI